MRHVERDRGELDDAIAHEAHGGLRTGDLDRRGAEPARRRADRDRVEAILDARGERERAVLGDERALAEVTVERDLDGIRDADRDDLDELSGPRTDVWLGIERWSGIAVDRAIGSRVRVTTTAEHQGS